MHGFRLSGLVNSEIEAFRYRARDAWRAATRIAIREARLQEINAEIMKSKRFKVIKN